MYCTFAEKVLVDGVLQKPAGFGQTGDYSIDTTTTPDSIKFTTAPADDALIKVLYSVQGGRDPFSDSSMPTS